MEKQNLSKIDLQTRPKYQVFNFLMLMGPTTVLVDPSHKEVDLPDYLMNAERVALEFGYDLPKPIDDLTVSPLALEATLSFNKTPYEVFIPWEAVEALTDKNGVGVYYGKRPIVSQEDIQQLQTVSETSERLDITISPQERRRSFKVLPGGKK